MAIPKQARINLYGNVKILQAHCESCNSTSFILDKKFACCDTPIELPIAELRKKRISEPPDRRLRPSTSRQKEILEEQDHRCYYCDQRFGEIVRHHDVSKPLRCEWDHVIPWALSQNNADENFVAACHFCNKWKSNLVFTSRENAQVYLIEKWKEHGKALTFGEEL